MEVGQLRALRELRDRGSIAAVARAMDVTPSSVSQQLSALARAAGCALTYREGRRTALTDAGRALAAAAVQVEFALGSATEAVKQFQQQPAGKVSVAAYHSASWALFPALLERFNEPAGIEVVLSDEDVAQQHFPQLTADYDLVIGHRLHGGASWPNTVQVVPLFFEPLDIAMPVDHRLAEKTVLQVADLRGEAWLAVHDGFPLRGAIEQIAGINGETAKIVHRINEFYVAARIVEAASCISLMPRFTVDRTLYPGLVMRPLEFPRLGRQVDCLMRPEALSRGNVQTVLEALRQTSRSLSQGD